jgi:hypothetical protein
LGSGLTRSSSAPLADEFEKLAKQYPDDDETLIFSAIYLIAIQSPSEKTFARAI